MEAGRQLAAETAEMIFASTPTLADGHAFYRDVKGRLEALGRSPDQLKIKLLSGPPEAIETNPEAYALYLQARHLTRQGSAEGYEQAVVSLQEALAIAPDCAPALKKAILSELV